MCSMKKRVFIGVVAVLTCLSLGVIVYLIVPVIASNIIRGKIRENPANHVREIRVTWGGPQTISGLHYEDVLGSADIDVTVHDSLFSLLMSDLYTIDIDGDVTIHTSNSSENASADNEDVVASAPQTSTTEISSFSLPKFTLNATINTLTFQGVEPLVYKDIHGVVSAEPGRVFYVELTAKTDTGGTISCEASAPDVLNANGTMNWDSTATLTFAIQDAAIPTINGKGGWSIIELKGNVSSPKLSDAINVSIEGELAEYDVPRGTILVKTQIISADNASTFKFSDREIVGSVDLIGVPTTILAPILNKYDIDPLRDIGATMDVHIERAKEGPPMQATFSSEKVQASGTIENDSGQVRDLSVSAILHSKLVSELTQGQLQGDVTAKIQLEQLVPVGASHNDSAECIGSIEIGGVLQHLDSKTTIEQFRMNFSVDVKERRFKADGVAVLDGTQSTFLASLHSTNKNKLNSFIHLIETIANQLPSGMVAVDTVPTQMLRSYVPEEQQKLLQYVGPTFSSIITFVRDGIHVEAISDRSQFTGTVQLQGNEIVSINDALLHLELTKSLASDLFGIPMNASPTILANISSIDTQGSAEFNVSMDIGNQRTFVQGKTVRQTEGIHIGQLDANLATTGIDTRLLDAILKCNGLLQDSLGSPINVEVQATNILVAPTILAGGTSPNSAFETSLGIVDGTLFTVPDVSTVAELQLSSALTKHLLKDLGPVLSDIRSVKHPIQMRVSNAQQSLDGDISTLHADVFIDIGEVELDSGSMTLDLLPMFNTKHVEIIPAFFDPIHIEIRNGVATYKKFNLTLVGKFSIPYSGTINFVTRQLNIKTAVPLTGLGYSIKELRGLTEDIDVPILITGTIDHPVTKVDPSFDLGKILQNATVNAIGDAIGDALGGGNKEAPNPLDLLEDLFGGH